MQRELKDLTIHLTAKDGHIINVYCWDQVENPKAILQVFHGMAEHAARYDRFARYLNTQGIIVVADDHRGHGETAVLNGKLGVIGSDGFNRIVEDENMITKIFKNKYPNLPVYVFAHSFGSFVGQDYITKYGKDIAGIFLCGTAAQLGADIKAGKLIASIQKKFIGEDKEAKLLDKMSFSAYNKNIKNSTNGFEWLSSDEAEVKKYIDDKKCGFVCSIGFYYYLSRGLLNLYNKEKLNNIPKSLPIFIIAGKEDPVGQYGEKVKKLFDIYRGQNITDVNMKLYEGCRHELLNEKNRDDVIEDVLEWLNKRIK